MGISLKAGNAQQRKELEVKRLLFILPIFLILACGGKKKVTNPAPNPAPANPLHGAWTGNLNLTFPGPHLTQDVINLTVTGSTVTLKLSDDPYPAYLQSAVDPDLIFVADLLGYVIHFTGERTNDIILGSASIPALNATGTWVVTKPGVILKVPPPSEHKSLRSLLK